MHRTRWIVITFLVGALIAATTVWLLTKKDKTPPPGCVITLTTTTDSTATTPDKPTKFSLSLGQIDNAATIAAVGTKLGMSPHAVTIALATAMQESQLRNLPGGDRDSVGLFQQRPSQGWGTAEQILDPVYASTAFYQKLKTVSGWNQLSVNDAAQAVQRSGVPMAYAQWETKAEAFASVLTGQQPAGMNCYGISAANPSTDLVRLANAELGTAALSGRHSADQGWAFSAWLIAHAQRVGVDRVSFNGQTWNADSGVWSPTGPADGTLSLHRATPTS